MQNKILLAKVALLLSEATGKPRKLCEDFLRELFAVVAEELENGENVKIKGFGTFKLIPIEARRSVDVSTGEDIEIEPHVRIAFVASKELNAIANAPFEMFGTLEIENEEELNLVEDEEVSIAEAVEGEETPLPKTSTPLIEEGNEAEDVNDDDVITDSDDMEVSEEADASEGESMAVHDVGGDAMEDDAAEEAGAEDGLREEQPANRRSFKFGWGFVAGFASALMIGALIYFLVGLFGYGQHALEESSSPTEKKDSNLIAVAAEPVEVSQSPTMEVQIDTSTLASSLTLADTKASDEIVYDTITHTRYLTTMAKDHYGNFNLWPYIYKENESRIGHPDRIRPGTRIVVPPLSKYGVDPKNPADIKKAKELGIAIYARYK